jgi:serine/threonine protein kinase
MGDIYRARRLHIGDTVAVKVLRPEVVDNAQSRQRFYREAVLQPCCTIPMRW